MIERSAFKIWGREGRKGTQSFNIGVTVHEDKLPSDVSVKKIKQILPRSLEQLLKQLYPYCEIEVSQKIKEWQDDS